MRTPQLSKWIDGDVGGIKSFQRKRKKLRILRGRRVKRKNIPLLMNVGFGG